MGRRGLIGATAVVACAVGASIAWTQRGEWGSALLTPLVLGVALLAVWLLVAAVVVLARWRPRGRLWVAAAVLSLSWSLFVISTMTPLDDGGLFNPAVVLRPSLFFLLLAWPSGYLTRSDRTWWLVYCFLQAGLLWVVPQLFEPGDGRLVGVADLGRLSVICHAFALAVVLPVGAVVLYVSVRRRTSLLTPDGRRVIQPIVTAAAGMMLSDIALSLWVAWGEPGFDDEGPELIGGLVLLLNYVPYAVAPVLMIAALGRARLASEGVGTIEIGRLDDALDRFASGADIAGVEVRFAGPAGTWLDRYGHTVPPPASSTDVVEIRREGRVLATVSTDPSLSPDQIERTVAGAGTSVDFARLAATARAGQREVSAARKSIDDAKQAAMVRLEQDLHDGAQQRLVGLALQAALARRAERDDDLVASEIGEGVLAARVDLMDAASGVFPSLIGTRGLSASIGTLAACTALHVDVDIDLPADLPPDIAAAAWFVAAESLTNAGKHASASRLRIHGEVEGAAGHRRLDLMIADDGRGGADAEGSGLVGLRRRVERSGGTLRVSSPIGEGTCVHASFPLPTPIGAAGW
jgi:signal transduction histidine kinase